MHSKLGPQQEPVRRPQPVSRLSFNLVPLWKLYSNVILGTDQGTMQVMDEEEFAWLQPHLNTYPLTSAVRGAEMRRTRNVYPEMVKVYTLSDRDLHWPTIDPADGTLAYGWRFMVPPKLTLAVFTEEPPPMSPIDSRMTLLRQQTLLLPDHETYGSWYAVWASYEPSVRTWFIADRVVAFWNTNPHGSELQHMSFAGMETARRQRMERMMRAESQPKKEKVDGTEA